MKRNRDLPRGFITKREAAAIAVAEGLYALGWSRSDRQGAGDFLCHADDIAQEAVKASDALFDALERKPG